MGTNYGTTTNSNGVYKLKNIPNGSYKLGVSVLNFETQEKEIILSGKIVKIDFTLKESTNSLNEVVIKGKTKALLLKQNAFKPEVLDADLLQMKATPIIDLLGSLSGINVRQQGGLGSEANIMVNGVSGKGIQTFVDGIPISLLGEAYSVNNISTNLVKRIEVYKGVVPVSFGADALGGVINIVTQSRYSDYVDASFTTGSWNTHRIEFGIKKYLNANKTNYLQLDGAFNYSDNNYWMDNVDIVVDELLNTKKGRARRFNDQYKSYLARLQYGFQNVSWADEFKILLATSLIDRQWQHGITAIIPWGEVTGKNNDLNTLISWRKRTANKSWDLSAMTGYNQINTQFNDVAGRTYFWDGTFVPSLQKAETGFYINGRTPNITTNNFFVRGNINYRINENNKINFTGLFSSALLKGNDKAGTGTFGEDFYKNPQTFSKFFSGISLENKFLNKKITSITSLKYYWLKSRVAGLKSNRTFDDYFENNNNSFGYGTALKIKWLSNLSSYIAYEYTLRIPDGDELFGDGINIGPNPTLIPERNHNLNFGIYVTAFQKKVTFDINGFYRQTDNSIFLNTVSRGLSAYFNLQKTAGKGFEMAITTNPTPQLSLFANATWQNITLKEPDPYGQIEKRHIGSRIPNNPYLFANFGTTYKFLNAFQTDNHLEFTYRNNYVHAFFRSWENDAKNDINKAKTPTQFIHNASIGYVFPDEKYSLFVESRNFTNEKTYDNFRVQKPGRSFYLKLRIFIN
tara:strand:+ start:3493 stop:5724 length:2232 start_codon:yes stop_codon:yes gene_type:complete